LVFAQQLDVTDATSVDAFFNAAVDAFGVPTAVVYAAGIVGYLAPLVEISEEVIVQVLETNLLGAFHAVQAASRRMVISRGGAGGSIVVISSEAGKFGGTFISPYAASKAGLNALVIGVARELATEGVRLNAISPGVIDTEQHAGISEERRLNLLASIPLGRMGEAREVANAVMWLLSGEASYVTGSVLTVAGGR
jgi:glucose 1-dehydrogenase